MPDLTTLWRAGDRDALAREAGRQAQLLRRVEGPLRVGLAEYGLMPLFREVEMPLIPVLVEPGVDRYGDRCRAIWRRCPMIWETHPSA